MKNSEREWLETDGLGGFASGTICGRRLRRYHALLLTAVPDEGRRYVLVNGLEVHVQTSAGIAALSSQRYAPNIIHPRGDRLIRNFQSEPWPTWEFLLPGELRVRQEYFIPHGSAAIVLKWTLLDAVHEAVSLSVRPLLSGRDYHSLHQANDQFCFDHTGDGQYLRWTPYPGVPQIVAMSTGSYSRDPLWYHRFYYAMEAERGLDCEEDLASPGVFRFDLHRGAAICVLTGTGPQMLMPFREEESVEQLAGRLEEAERARRTRFACRTHRSADQFLIQSGTRKTIIAGYPWFTDWGRDTFIACRGLCLTTGALDQAGEILRDWSGTVSEGMLPNRFPDGTTTPEYNSVDASLWFIVAVHDYLHAKKQAGREVSKQELKSLQQAVLTILEGYARGTRFQIQADDDGLLRAGVPGQQLTWMDARVDGWVVTPRIGKPVEIQALWIHALWIGGQFDSRWQSLEARARASFQTRFWNEQQGCLYDVIDVDHQPGNVDGKIRPNQLLAVGGLPQCLLEKPAASSVVERVERDLLTPHGVRTLAPGDPDYHPHYLGDLRARDAAYHQGTVWPWLMGPFVEAWLRVHGNSAENRAEARRRFLQPMLDHLDEAGLGHLSEIADAEPTSTSTGLRQIPRGCPFQAWSLAELLRVLEQC